MSVKEYLKRNYFSWPDLKSVKDAFSLNITNEGLKAATKFALYGTGLFSLDRVSDWYMNSPSLRETVSNALAYLPDFWNIENNARHYLTIGGIQNNILPVLNLAPGEFTNYAAEAGIVLAGVSLACLGAKKIIRDMKKKSGKKVEKFALADIGNVMKNSPISSALTAANLYLCAAALPGYLLDKYNELSENMKEDALHGTRKGSYTPPIFGTISGLGAIAGKSKSRFSGIMDSLKDYYYNANIL